MGGSNSKTPQMRIVIEKESIIAGESLYGKIELLIPKNLPNAKLMLYVRGSEIIKSKNEPDLSRKLIFMNTTKLIHLFSDPKNIGTYAMPFNIDIPSDSPSTFSFSKDGTESKIKYSIISDLLDKDSYSTARQKLNIVVDQAITTERMSLTASDFRFIKCCGFSKRGKCIISAYINKNAYLPGETMFINIDASNPLSSLKIKSIRVKLVRIISVTYGNGTDRVFQQLNFDRNLKFGSDGVGKLIDGGIEISIPIKYSHNGIDLCPTTNGKIIKCDYHLYISSNCGFFNTSGPTLDFQILVFPKERIITIPSAPEFKINLR